MILIALRQIIEVIHDCFPVYVNEDLSHFLTDCKLYYTSISTNSPVLRPSVELTAKSGRSEFILTSNLLELWEVGQLYTLTMYV